MSDSSSIQGVAGWLEYADQLPHNTVTSEDVARSIELHSSPGHSYDTNSGLYDLLDGAPHAERSEWRDANGSSS